MVSSTLVAVALLLGLVAPLLRAAAWGVPFGLLTVRMVVASVLGTVVVTLLAGGLAAGCAMVLPTARLLDPAPVIAAAGGLVGAAYVLGSAFRMRRLRGALLLAHRLGEPAVREGSLAALQALLDEVRPAHPDADYRTYAALVLLAAPPMTQAGLWSHAERLLDQLPAGSIDPRQRALRAQALATCRLQHDDVAGAKAVLQEVERPSSDSALDRWLHTTEALVLAVEGDVDQALARVGEGGEQSDPVLRASQRVVRAHVYAARGERDRALQELRAVRREVGAPALERAMHPTGPATDLARDVFQEPDLGS